MQKFIRALIKYLFVFLSIILISCGGGGACNSQKSNNSQTALSVFLIAPNNNATNVATLPLIELKFSESVINVNNINILLIESNIGGTSIALTPINNLNNNNYTFSPTSALNEQTNYYIVVKNGITNISGNQLNTTIFKFTTGDFTAPTVALYYPTNGESDVTLMPTITLQFSKNVQNVNSSNILLYQDSIGGIPVAISSINAQANNYSFSPQTFLNDDTTYYIVVESGITDISGNPLTPVNFNFTTLTTS